MRPASNPWVVLAMLLAIYIVNYADRYLITGLIGPIKAEFGLSALLGWAAAHRVEQERARLNDALSIRPSGLLLARAAAERG